MMPIEFEFLDEESLRCPKCRATSWLADIIRFDDGREHGSITDTVVGTEEAACWFMVSVYALRPRLV